MNARVVALLGGAGVAAAATLAVSAWYWSGGHGPSPIERPEGDLPEVAPAAVHPTKVAPAGDDPLQLELAGVDFAVARAIETAQAAVRKSPQSADTWGRLGMTLLAHQFYTPGASCFARAARYNPRDPRWPYLQALSIQTTDPRIALALFQKAAELCNDDPDAPRFRLVKLLLQLDRLDEADRQLRGFLSRDPRSARAHLAAGRLALHQGDLQGCLEHLRQAKTHDAGHKAASMLMAEVYRRLGQTELAERERQEASKAPGGSWPDPYYDEVSQLQTGLKAMLVRADLLYGQQRIKQSIELLRKASREYPDSAWARILLGRALIRRRQLAEAERVLREALELSPESVEAQFRLGVALYLQGRRLSAAKWYRKAVQLKPDFTMAHYNLGVCLKELNDPQSAIQAFRNAVQCRPDYFEAHALLGDLLARQGHLDEARNSLQRAVGLKPDNTWARKRLDELSAPDSSEGSKH